MHLYFICSSLSKVFISLLDWRAETHVLFYCNFSFCCKALQFSTSASALSTAAVVLHFTSPLQLVLSTELQFFSTAHDLVSPHSLLCFAWQCISGQRAMIARPGGLPYNCTTQLTSFKIIIIIIIIAHSVDLSQNNTQCLARAFPVKGCIG